jgi:hypothetical protein
MNKQEAFNKIYLGLKSQGFEKSFNETIYRCQYRGPNGLKCAVGHLIPDDKYHESLEKLNPYDLIKVSIIDFPMLDSDFLVELQSIHDISKSPEKLELELRQVAVEFDLTIPENIQ